MTAPVRFARAFAIAAVPLFDRLVMSLLSAVAVFLPEVMIDVVSWSKALMRCCWNVSCLRASLIWSRKILICLAVRVQAAGLQRVVHAVECFAGGGVDAACCWTLG